MRSVLNSPKEFSTSFRSNALKSHNQDKTFALEWLLNYVCNNKGQTYYLKLRTIFLTTSSIPQEVILVRVQRKYLLEKIYCTKTWFLALIANCINILEPNNIYLTTTATVTLKIYFRCLTQYSCKLFTWYSNTSSVAQGYLINGLQANMVYNLGNETENENN